MPSKRANGEGTVRKRKDGRWEGFITVGHKENGKPIYKSVFAKTQKELMPKLRKLIDDYKGVELTEESGMTVREWLDTWMKEYAEPKLRPSTICSYRHQCNVISEYIGDKVVNLLTAADCQRMYNKYKKSGRKRKVAEHGAEVADSSVRRLHMMFHEAMDAAWRRRLIACNPTEGTVVPACNYKEMAVLDEEQLDKYMEAIKTDPLWHDLFYVELTTGLRLGELCGLKWEDFDDKKGTLKIQRSIGRTVSGKQISEGDPKTEKGKRTIKLPDSTFQVLLRRKEKCKGEWVFPSLKFPRKPTAPSAAYHRHKQILKELELPSIRFHDLRHTFATMALEYGMDIKTLSAIIGHVSSATTLDIYSHITTEMEIKAAQTIDRAIGKTDTTIKEDAVPTPKKRERTKIDFKPKQGKIRKSGTGGIYQLNDHLWEGRYTPTNAMGKRESHNVYAKTREECEEALNKMIIEVREQIQKEKEQLKGMSL